jgi:agmatinase
MEAGADHGDLMTAESTPPTFLGAPRLTDPTRADAEVAVIGVPCDAGVTGRAGTREGPNALRSISGQWAYRQDHEPFWDGETKTSLLAGIRIVDAGDVQAPAAGEAAPFPPEVIAAKVEVLLSNGLFPLVLGGDHSITYPVLLGVHSARGMTAAPLQLVQFDAHMDYWDHIDGDRFTHASPIIRAHEGGLVGSVVQYGIRGLHTAADNLALARDRGVATFWCEQIKREMLERGAERAVERLTQAVGPGIDTWLTFDIDCLDPAVAPGTGVPEPGGFTYYEARALLRAVCARANVIGMDLVEVSSAPDPGELAALHGARLIIDALGAVFGRRRPSAGAAARLDH